MLMNLHRKDWSSGLMIKNYQLSQKRCEQTLTDMAKLSKNYAEKVKEEEGKTPEEIEVMNVGKIDPRRHLESDVHDLMAESIIQCLGTMLSTVLLRIIAL